MFSVVAGVAHSILEEERLHMVGENIGMVLKGKKPVLKEKKRNHSKKMQKGPKCKKIKNKIKCVCRFSPNGTLSTLQCPVRRVDVFHSPDSRQSPRQFGQIAVPTKRRFKIPIRMNTKFLFKSRIILFFSNCTVVHQNGVEGRTVLYTTL